MNSKLSITLLIFGVFIFVLGYSTIRYSYDLGIDDKYNFFIGFGIWACAGGLCAFLPLANKFIKLLTLQQLAIPLGLWALSPAIIMLFSLVSTVWF